MRKLILVASMIFAAHAAVVQGAVPASVAPFFGARFDQPLLSPDGEHIAVRRTADGREAVEIFRLEDSQSINVFSFEEGTGVLAHAWIDEQTITVAVRVGDTFFGGFPRGRFSYDIHTKKGDRLFDLPIHQPMGFGDLAWARSKGFADLFVPNAFDDNDDVRVMLKKDARISYVHSYDTHKDRYRELAEVPGQAYDVYTDRSGNVLAAWGRPPTVGRKFQDQVQLLYRSNSEEDFRLAHSGHMDDFEIDLVAEGPNENSVYILEDIHGDSLGLSVLDLETGEIKTVLRPARTDVLKTYLDGKRSLYAIRYDDHFPQFHYPNPRHPAAVIHQGLVKTYKNKNVELTSFSQDNNKVVALVSADNEPGKYYVLDVAKRTSGELFERAPEAAKQDLGQRQPIEFPARDGTRVTGYLTLPKGHTQGRIPLVVLPHDDLFSQPATWGYRMEAQLFASNGMAVLEVNHRGTVGFGRAFWAAGVGEIAELQLSDIADGVAFAIETGVAAEDRVCIVGHRGGAYTAFMSAIRRPNLYSCVVTIAGLYDIASIRRAIPIGGARDRYTRQMAGEGANETTIDSISPHLLGRQIRPPLLLVEARQYSESLPRGLPRFLQTLKQGSATYEIHEESTNRTNNMLTDINRANAYGKIIDFVQQHTGS